MIKSGLKKVLGLWDSVAIILAIVIGVGIFRVPAEIAAYLKSPWLIMLAWLCGGIIVFFGVLCYAELSSAFPETGGNYIYLRQSYGHLVAFLFGWSELFVVRTGSIAAVAFISAEYLQSLLSLNKLFIKPLAIASIFLLSTLNAFGLRLGKRAQNLFTAANILAILTVIILGFLSGKGRAVNFFATSVLPWPKAFIYFGLALIPILWTYGGWHENTFVAGETKDASRVLPAALLIALSLVVALYLAINFLYLYLMPAEKIAVSPLIGSDMMHILYADRGRKIFELLIVISSLACINAMIITGSRITYALANDNAIFRYLGEVNSRYNSPLRAMLINCFWSSLLIFLGAFNKLLFFTGILVWLFFGLAGIGLFILRRRYPGIKRPYMAWGYPFTPAIFILICGALFINTFIFSAWPSLFGLLLMASGIPVYIVSRKKAAQ